MIHYFVHRLYEKQRELFYLTLRMMQKLLRKIRNVLSYQKQVKRKKMESNLKRFLPIASFRKSP